MTEQPLSRRLIRSGVPVLTPILRELYRLKYVIMPVAEALNRSLTWYFRSKEYTNFTYELSERSKKYLIAFLASEFRVERQVIIGLLDELKDDAQLARFWDTVIPSTADRYFADMPIKLGRRAGWYAIIRIIKPKLVIESGIDRGIGSVVIASALQKNAEEGYPGKLIGLDINPFAGSYIQEPYASHVQIELGNSLQFLSSLSEQVDIFLHDSNHARAHELGEFERVLPHLTPDGLLMSDNAELTDALYDFAEQHGLTFSYWQEDPVDHILPGGGIAISRPAAQLGG